MATWSVEGARTGSIAGSALAVFLVLQWTIDCFRRDPESRRDQVDRPAVVLMAALMAAIVAGSALAGGSSGSAVHALIGSMPLGFGRTAAAMVLGSVVGALVEGALGACAVLLFGIVFTPHDGQISLGAIMIGCMGAVFGGFVGALIGYLATAR